MVQSMSSRHDQHATCMSSLRQQWIPDARHAVWAQARKRFEQGGGTVLERTAVQGVRVHPDGVALQLPAPQQADGASEQVICKCLCLRAPVKEPQVMSPDASWGTPCCHLPHRIAAQMPAPIQTCP